MRTKIFIRPDYTSSWLQLDVMEEVPAAFNYQVSDIRNPESRQQSYSKTIKLPGSKVNNQIFTDIFDIDWSASGAFFNPLKKANAEWLLDDTRVFYGYLQLIKIYQYDNNKIDYDVVLIGQIANIFADLGEKKLHELDFSDLDHTYTKANIEASWSTTNGTGYVYPMILRDQTIADTFTINDFIPAIFVKEYVDRIFSEAGFEYSSSFFNSTYFKKLILPFNGKTFGYTSAVLTNRLFRASQVGNDDDNVLNAVSVEYRDQIVQFNDNSTAPNQDAGGNFNTVSHRFNPQTNGAYRIFTKVVAQLLMQPVNTTTNGILTDYSYFISIRKNGVDLFPPVIKTITLDINYTGGVAVAFGNDAYIEYVDNAVVGDYYDVLVSYPAYNSSAFFFNTTDPSDSIQFRIGDGSLFYTQMAYDSIQPGELISMDSAAPYNFRQRDFLMGLVRMFNLYIDVDPDNDKKLLIEPFNDYYLSGQQNVIDWTDKLDESKEIEITPVGQLENRSFLFTYKKDEDYYNKQYASLTNEVYGQEIIETENEFTKEQKKIELPFAPTPLVGEPDSDRIVPRIFDFDNQNGVLQRASVPRILFWGGLISSDNNWFLIQDGSAPTIIGTYSQYPYAGHLDNPYSPDEDLSFGAPIRLFYSYNSFIALGELEYTDSNLYNKYWRKYIEEISDKESKIVTCWLRLTAEDIQFLSFRKLYAIKGYIYRLQKIYDYNPIAESITKVEFIKVKEGVQVNFTKDVVIGGDLQTIGNITSPLLLAPRLHNNGAFRPGNMLNFGLGNITGLLSQQVIINGSGNSVGQSCQRISILGEGNVVGANSSGIAIINASGCTLEGANTDITLIGCTGVTVAQGVSDVLVIGAAPRTITMSGIYINELIDTDEDPPPVVLDLDDTAIFSANVLTIPSGNTYTSIFELTGASASYTINQIVSPPDVEFMLYKAGSITTLQLNAGTDIKLPSPVTKAMLNGTANDYIKLKKVTGNTVKQTEINVY